MIERLEYIIKHNTVVQKMYVVAMSRFFRSLGLFIKVDKKQVLINSLIGKSYGDSPRVIFEAMKKDPVFKDYKYVWAFDDPDKFDVDGADKVKLNSLKYFITALRSGLWITNVNIERGLKFKPKGTVYLDTWHGTGPLKIDGNAQKNRSDYDFSNIDIFCSSSNWHDSRLLKDFRVRKKNIIRCGMPRNDALYNTNAEEINILREKYQVPKGKKVILYAPTWRERADGGKSRVISPPIDVQRWKDKLADEYVLLFRMHHLTSKALKIKYDSFVRDFSGSCDVNELMKIADILITDYSSILTDYSILEKPIVLFAYDYEEYYESRGLYKKLEEILPGYICSNQDEVIDMIVNMDRKKAIDAVKKLKQNYAYTKGDSTSVCMKALKSKIAESNQ